MANIEVLLENISKAQYGKEVRNSIHDAIYGINKEVEQNTTYINERYEQIEKNTESAKQYAETAVKYGEMAEEAVANVVNSLTVKGEIAFSQLPTEGIHIGDIYIINEKFVTDERFKDGIGVTYEPYALVYRTENDMWDILGKGYGSGDNDRVTENTLNIIALELELSTLTSSTIEGTTDNVVIETFADNNDITITHGEYDSENHRVWA